MSTDRPSDTLPASSSSRKIEEEFEQAYTPSLFERLVRSLQAMFPCLDRERCSDLVQDLALATLTKIRGERFQPGSSWEQYLRWITKKRAIDYLRRYEIAKFNTLSGRNDDSNVTPLEPINPAETPSQVLAKAERDVDKRQRQGLTLSEIFVEFVARCEARTDGSVAKEIYERTLRGETPNQIAEELQIPRNTVDVSIKRSREWILERMREADVNRSIFETFHRGKPEPRGSNPSPATGSSPHPARSETKVALRATGSTPNHPLQLPPLEDLGDVVRWVISELGAFCPSPKRFEAFCQTPDDAQFSDVWYHIAVAACPICNAEQTDPN